ncbi:MAG TPA: hypothetical protein ENJ08_11935 [Gammaproteobacteria bacterium]|nr:hypothetical protein [Gammaproteobacteria bacterium]
MTTTLTFHQLYPEQTLPILAKDYAHNTPRRAELFCHPFKEARDAGCYFFSPVAFDFKLTDKSLSIRSKRDDGTYKAFEVLKSEAPSNNNFILLQDVSEKTSERCQEYYRDRLKDQPLPDFINRETFGFYEIMLNVFAEKSPDDFFIQIWLGGVIETPAGVKVAVKHASNTQMDAGFLCLDGIIDTGQWHGWFAVVLKPQRKNEWVSVNCHQPLCQITGDSKVIDTLNIIPSKEVATDIFIKPVQWHICDKTYGRKPGKYQRAYIKKAQT